MYLTIILRLEMSKCLEAAIKEKKGIDSALQSKSVQKRMETNTYIATNVHLGCYLVFS